MSNQILEKGIYCLFSISFNLIINLFIKINKYNFAKINLFKLCRIFSKKKDDKYMKINENVKVNQENNLNNKENLFQRFSNKEQNKNTEKPVYYKYIT